MQQRELAERAGVSEGLISMIVSGARRPSWDVAKKLCKITGTDLQLWMEGNADKKKAAIDRVKGGDKK